ncbi:MULTISPECIES: ABC transporter substrate-binding protein [Streptomyces]|jgi:oligopeptide transport system substrate-binding protein|uniref:peptide ABC transporter substrate-binding protein n=1 Tax=Streptomyces TaxID=1883 RepID=UPI0019043483|nr:MULTISPECIES: ABC transporter substrate-binding protein [unclassified Streptomyces]MCU4746899.1 ABC transporter substrate-binding protein [Streptomyces sp. G-5]QQN77595.1 ABC transporter substrate-binding protein [Streptomyces sp. XC 2026]
MRGARSAKWAAVAIVVALAATACGSDDDKGGSGDGGNASGNASGIVKVDGGEPQSALVPTSTNEQFGSLVIKNVFANLLDFEDDGSIKYVAAESIESNDDASVWTVKLKDGFTFHDGEKVTAQHYVDAWNWAANVDNGQSQSAWFEDIEGYADVHPAEEGAEPTADTMSGLKVVDDSTFEITLANPVSYYEYKLGYHVFAPLPSSFYDDPDAFGQAPVGQGPYEFTGWTHNEKITLTTYADYAGPNKAQNGGVEIIAYDNLSTAYQDLQSGNLDVLRQVDPKDLPVYQDDLGDRAIAQPYNATQSIVPAFYAGWGDLDDPSKVLQGVSMAIDRETITQTVLNGSRTPADSFTPPGVFGHLENAADGKTDFNPEEARRLVEEGGGVPGDKITLQINGDGGHAEWATAVCNDIIKNLDVECVLDTKPDFATDLADRRADKVKSMYRGGWLQDYPLNVNFLRDLYSTTAPSNYGRYSNEEVDNLFKQGDQAGSFDETVAAYQEAEKVLWEDMPAIPLWYQNVNGGYSTNVENVHFDVAGQPVIEDITVK